MLTQPYSPGNRLGTNSSDLGDSSNIVLAHSNVLGRFGIGSWGRPPTHQAGSTGAKRPSPCRPPLLLGRTRLTTRCPRKPFFWHMMSKHRGGHRRSAPNPCQTSPRAALQRAWAGLPFAALGPRLPQLTSRLRPSFPHARAPPCRCRSATSAKYTSPARRTRSWAGGS